MGKCGRSGREVERVWILRGENPCSEAAILREPSCMSRISARAGGQAAGRKPREVCRWPAAVNLCMMTRMRELYPPIEPFDSGMLPVSPVHTLYYEQCGNSEGRPVVFLHGGPGGGLIPDYRRYFDPAAYRVVLFDQRGSGRSTPHASLEDNTTWHLVEDIETLRAHLRIQDWHVFGGSWGSTLALAYAERHPGRVRSLTLRGIFLCRPKEIRWFYQEGASYIFPDVWEEFEKVIPAGERNDFVSAYYRRLTSEDEAVRVEAARAWSVWEGSTSKLYFDYEMIEKFADPEFALAFARIECHYFTHNAFFETDHYLIEQVDKIRDIPTVIVQGRYDVVCPMISAWELYRAFPEADLQITPDAGHSALEPGNRSALVEATDRFRDAPDRS
jgi:proline iminopeptidase